MVIDEYNVECVGMLKSWMAMADEAVKFLSSSVLLGNNFNPQEVFATDNQIARSVKNMDSPYNTMAYQWFKLSSHQNIN